MKRICQPYTLVMMWCDVLCASSITHVRPYRSHVDVMFENVFHRSNYSHIFSVFFNSQVQVSDSTLYTIFSVDSLPIILKCLVRLSFPPLGSVCALASSIAFIVNPNVSHGND